MFAIGKEKTKWRDSAWKEVISDCPRSAIEFLMPDLAADMADDMKPVRKLDGISGRELHSKGTDSDRGMLVNDLFFNIPMLDGECGNIAFFIEQMHEKSDELPRRVFDTFVRLREKLRLRTTCLVIFTGSSPNMNTYVETCYGCEVTMKYRTYYLPEKSADELRADKRPFAPVMLAGRLALDAGDDIKLREKYAAEIHATTPKSKERMFIIDFARRIFKVDDPEISKELKEVYELETMPLEEYRKQIRLDNARIETLEEVAISLLEDGMPLQQVAKHTRLPIEELQKMKPH